MKFQLGSETSASYNQSLCQNKKFPQETWVTQGKVTVFSEEACPISGEYTADIPDAFGLCVKLQSDCHNLQPMFYSVSNCHKLSEVYEEREYRCLGKFADRGLTYTARTRSVATSWVCRCHHQRWRTLHQRGWRALPTWCGTALRLGMKVARQATC